MRRLLIPLVSIALSLAPAAAQVLTPPLAVSSFINNTVITNAQGEVDATEMRSVLNTIVSSVPWLTGVYQRTISATGYTAQQTDQASAITFSFSTAALALPKPNTTTGAFQAGWWMIANAANGTSLSITPAGTTINGSASSYPVTENSMALISSNGTSYQAITIASSSVGIVLPLSVANGGTGSSAGIISGLSAQGAGATNAPTMANRATDFGTTFDLRADFGAACNNSTDDTAAIQNWLNKAAAGVNLVSPGGTCLFSTPLTAPTANSYAIGGAGSSVTALRYTGATTSSPLINLGTASEIGIIPHDLSVTSVNSTTGPNLAIDGTAYTPPSPANRRTVNVLDYGADPTGATDSTVAINAAIATGTNANLTGAYNPETCLYFPAGNYTVSNALTLPIYNACLIGDGRTLSILNVSSATFNLSALGVVVVQPNNGATGPIIRDIGIQFSQPDTSSRGSIVAFPPGVYMQDVSRPIIERVRIGGGSSCIDARGNTGGAFYSDNECGALVTGLLLGGPATYSGGQGLRTVTGGSYTGSTATLTGTWSTLSPAKVAVVQGASPSCLNGSWPITANSSGSVSFTVAGCSAWTSGGTVSTNGAADGVHLHGWHEWNFGITTSGLLGIYGDGTNQCMSIGRVDWVGASDIQCYSANMVYNADANNAEDTSNFSNVAMDDSQWQQSGGFNAVSGYTTTDGGSTPPGSATPWGPAVLEAGGALTFSNFSMTRHNATSAGAIEVTGGALSINSTLQGSGQFGIECVGPGTNSCVTETGGVLSITNSFINPINGGVWSVPYIYQTGGVIQVSGNWLETGYAGGYTAVDVTVDNAGSYVKDNNLNGWVNVLPFSNSETQYGMNSTVGSLSSTTANYVNLLSGAAEAAFYFSQLSGQSGWVMGQIVESSNYPWVLRDKTNNLDAIEVQIGGNILLGSEATSTVTAVYGSLASKSGFAPSFTGSCTVGTLHGGQMGGDFKATSGCSSAETITLTFAATQTDGYSCEAHDMNTPATLINETSTNATTVTFTLAGAMATNDVAVWKCVGY